MTKLTNAQVACLEYYKGNEENSSRIFPVDAKFNMRQVNAVLMMGLLKVGPDGWHVLSQAGRSALARANKGGGDA